MCKTWAVVHTCGHTAMFRLSTCHGSYTHTTRKSKEPSSLCRGSPSWGFKSTLRCGPCNKAREEQRLEAEIAQIRVELADAEDWLMDAEQGYASELWKLNEKYPDGKFKKLVRPDKNRRPARKSSLLQNELKMEDVPEAPHNASRPRAIKTSSWDQWNWAAGWASLDADSTDSGRSTTDADSDADIPALSMDTWELNGWNDPEPLDSEPVLVEPESPPALREPASPPSVCLPDDVALLDTDLDPEEDLFTFPGERFRAVSAPVTELGVHTVDYAAPDGRKKRAHGGDWADGMAGGWRALSNGAGRWALDFGVSS